METISLAFFFKRVIAVTETPIVETPINTYTPT